MQSNDRIIDRDVEFYTAEAEFCTNELCRCPPSMEKYWIERGSIAVTLRETFIAYRTAMDKPKVAS